MPTLGAFRRPITVALTVLALVAPIGTAAADNTLLRLATAEKEGVYYPAGGAICRFVNADRFEHGIRCLTLATQGSIANLQGLRRGVYDLALVQSDSQFHAVHGSDAFRDSGPNPALRSVLALHVEAFTLVARRDSNIQGVADLKGKRVNVGPPSSGSRATLTVLLAAVGLAEDDLALIAELPVSEQGGALCDTTLDAVIYLVGHPNRAIEELARDCDVVLVPISDPAFDALLDDHPYYRQTVIPGETYVGNPQSVRTIGTVATLVASVRTDARAVYETVRAVFDNLEAFKRMHPALANLDRQSMTRDGLTAPLHLGAIRYYRQHLLR